MRKLFLLGFCIIFTFSFGACKKDDAPVASSTPKKTEVPTEEVSNAPVTISPTAVTPTATAVLSPEATDLLQTTEIPLDFQKEGWISSDEASTLLRMYLGSYDDSGNELAFLHESTILRDDKYYYNFKITSLVISESGQSNQSYFGNYLVSTDGNDIIEY